MNRKILKMLLLAALSAISEVAWSQSREWAGNTLNVAPDASIFYNGGDPTDDNTLYLFNLGAAEDAKGRGAFLNTGGHWGVEASTYEVGIPVYIRNTGGQSKNPICEILVSPQTGAATQNHIAWIKEGVESNDSKGIFIDRKSEEEELKNNIIAVSKWQFYETGEPNVYWIYKKLGVGRWAYLCHPGDDSQRRHDILVAREGKSVETSNMSKWLLVSRKDLIKKFEQTPADYRHIADATFYILDQNFSRNSGHSDAWVLKAEGTATAKIGNRYNQAWADGKNYTVGTSSFDQALTTLGNGTLSFYNLLYGSFFNAEIKGGKGSISQTTIPITKAGYYMVTCQGFYKPGDGSDAYHANLYAKTSRSGATLGDDAYAKAKLPLWSSLPGGPENLTQSGIKFYENQENYSAKVIVWLNEGERLELGVEVDGVTSKPEDDWAAFDNMQLKYLGGEFPVLDTFGQQEWYLDYGDQQFTTMVLLRDFQLGKWNSILLPNSLNKDQVLTAFGSDVQLAKLKGLDDEGRNIAFETVDLKSMAWTDVAMEKNEPYLIMPFTAGREFTITWNKLYSEEGQPKPKTHGPHYIIPAASISVSEIDADKQQRFSLSDGKTITLIPNLFWSSEANEKHGKIQASADNFTYVMNKGDLTRYKRPFALKGTRWYLVYSDASGSPAKINITNRSAKSTVTDIATVSADGDDASRKARGGVYTMGGQKLRDGNATDGLPGGYYIVDGKKVAVY